MEVKAKLKSLRMSPRKVRLAADLVRGKKVKAALDQLAFSSKWSAKPISKLIQSAIANAKNNLALSEDNLYIKEISVDGGATLKRWMPRAQGRATPLKKRTSHVNVVLAEIKPSQLKAEKSAAMSKAASADHGSVVKDEVQTEKQTKTEVQSEAVDANKKVAGSARVGQGKHPKGDGGKRGFTTKVFRRKSG